jgi:hypothetical protein
LANLIGYETDKSSVEYADKGVSGAKVNSNDHLLKETAASPECNSECQKWNNGFLREF